MDKFGRWAGAAVVGSLMALGGCNWNDDEPQPSPTPTATPTPAPAGFVGAVYAGTNKTGGNTVVAFGRRADGTLNPIGEYGTGGAGRTLDGAGDGLDPFVSEDSIVVVDNRYLLVVNAGSDTITSFAINADFSLTSINTAPTGGVGPVSITYRNGLVYVANADTDGVFTGPPDQSGNVTGLRLDTATGRLSAIAGSTRQLGARPSDVELSPDGRHLVIASYNAGSTKLAGSSTAEIQSFGVTTSGDLSALPEATGISTLPGNAAGRNVPGGIGFEIVDRGGRQFVLVTESREFLPNGDPAMPPMFQTGSVSSWELGPSGSLTSRSTDVLTGPAVTGGPTSACWIVAAPDGSGFWVASASGATISSYRLNADGTIALIDGRAAAGAAAMPTAPNPLAGADGFIDIAVSGDGQQVYQLLGLKGTINVYAVGSNGSLTLRQQAMGSLPMSNIQGLAFAGSR